MEEKVFEPYIYHSKAVYAGCIRVTVVGILEEGVLKLAASRCSYKDQFCKKTGREIAIARLKENNFITEYKLNEGEMQLVLPTFIEIAKIIAGIARDRGVRQKVEITNNPVTFSYGVQKGSTFTTSTPISKLIKFI